MYAIYSKSGQQVTDASIDKTAAWSKFLEKNGYPVWQGRSATTSRMRREGFSCLWASVSSKAYGGGAATNAMANKSTVEFTHIVNIKKTVVLDEVFASDLYDELERVGMDTYNMDYEDVLKALIAALSK